MTTRRAATRAVMLSTLLAAPACGSGQNDHGANPPAASPPTSTSASTGRPTTTATRPPAPSTSEAPKLPECKLTGLRLGLSRTEGTAGTFYVSVRFTNEGKSSCVIAGFPGVSYVDENGKQVGSSAVRSGAKGPQVTLLPGAGAAALLAMTDAGVFDPDTCRPAPVSGLRVYPPDEYHAGYLPHPGTGCAGPTPEPQLRVRTIVPGPDGR